MHPHLCDTGVKQSKGKPKFGGARGGGEGGGRSVQKSKSTALPRGPSQESGSAESRKAGGTSAAAGPRVSSRLEHLQRGVVPRKGGSGEHNSPIAPHQSTGYHQVRPGTQMSPKAENTGVCWRPVPSRRCTTPPGAGGGCSGWGHSREARPLRRGEKDPGRPICSL